MDPAPVLVLTAPGVLYIHIYNMDPQPMLGQSEHGRLLLESSGSSIQLGWFILAPSQLSLSVWKPRSWDPNRDGSLAFRSHTECTTNPRPVYQFTALSNRGRCGACYVGPTKCYPHANLQVPVVQSSAITSSAHQVPSWPPSPTWPVLFCGLCTRVQGYPDSLPGGN